METSWALWIPASAVLWLLGLGWIFARLPRWSRPGLAFAVSVAPGFPDSETGRAILARYRREVGLATAVVVAAALALLAGGARLAQWTHSLLLPQVGGFTWVYLRARRATLPHAVRHEEEAAPGSQARVTLPGGPIGQAGPFALLAAAAAWIASRMGGLPDSVPVHYGLDLQADAWAPPTWPTLLGPLLVGAAICAALLLMSRAMTRRTRPPADEAQAERLALMLRVLLGVNYLTACLFVGLGVAMLHGGEELDPAVVGLLIAGPELVALGLVVWLLARFGRLQARSGGGEVLGDRTEDRFWKAGLVYYNPDDPTLFVEKRFGIGYTMNMARPASWGLLGAIVGLPLLVALLLALLG